MYLRKSHLVVAGVLLLGTLSLATFAATGSGAGERPSVHATKTPPIPGIKKKLPASSNNVTYIQGSSTVDPGKFNGLSGKCPKSAPRAIGGLFDSGSDQVALTQSRPDGKGKWAVGVTNFGSQPANWQGGIVCSK